MKVCGQTSTICHVFLLSPRPVAFQPPTPPPPLPSPTGSGSGRGIKDYKKSPRGEKCSKPGRRQQQGRPSKSHESTPAAAAVAVYRLLPPPPPPCPCVTCCVLSFSCHCMLHVLVLLLLHVEPSSFYTRGII